jgi:tetratricopeptide (TPR) repeat protein
MPLNATTLTCHALRLQAAFALLLGRKQRALELWSSVLQRWPGDAHAMASRAHILAQLGRVEEAIAASHALTAAHPARSAADWFNLAFLLEKAGRLEQAEAAFGRALALDDKLDRAWYGLGLVLVRLGRNEQAVAALRRNTELQPMSPYAWYQLACVHAQGNRPEEAQKIIRHLKGFEPKVAAQLERETGLLA